MNFPNVETPFDNLLSDTASRIGIALFGVTLGPVIEELLFRGFLQPVLVDSMGVLPGILVTSVLFGALHLSQNAIHLAERRADHAGRFRARRRPPCFRLDPRLRDYPYFLQLASVPDTGAVGSTWQPEIIMIETIKWNADGVVMIDQTRLPAEEKYVTCRTYSEVADAIRTMIIRGAPAIGVAAAMGVAIGVAHADRADLDAQFETICAELASTRPTAVNLFWGIERMKRLYASVRHLPVEQIRERLITEAKLVREEDIEINRAIGRHGAPLVPDGRTVLTHCNAGALATAGYGTALGVVRAAVEAGKNIDVYADETRPFLQGARLTVWELQHDGIRATLITDNMAGHFLHAGQDRLRDRRRRPYRRQRRCREQDRHLWRGRPREREQRAVLCGRADFDARPHAAGRHAHSDRRAQRQQEVTHLQGVRVAPEGTAARNPAFDVTPNRYVTAIITELGVARAPYLESLRELTGRGRLDEPILAGL